MCARVVMRPVVELTSKFDRLDLNPATLRYSAEEIEAECAKVSEVDCVALELAADRIRVYHARQMPDDQRWTDEAGAELGWALDAGFCCWAICSRWIGELSVFGLNECHSRQGRGR